MADWLKPIDFCKGGWVDLDLNSEPISETDDTPITADSDSGKKCDFLSLGNKFEERGRVVNVELDKGVELAAAVGGCVEESKLVQCGVGAVVERSLGENRELSVISNVPGFIKEEPVLLQEFNVGNGCLKVESERSGQAVENDGGSDRDVELTAAVCAEESKLVQCVFDAARECNLGRNSGLSRISNLVGSIKEEPVTLQESNVGKGCLKLESDISGQAVAVGSANSLDGGTSDLIEDEKVIQKGKRGRKRKNAENAKVCDDEVKRKKNNHKPLVGQTGNCGRVLRSKVNSTSQAETQQTEANPGFVDASVVKEDHKHDINLPQKAFKTRGRKKKKDGRGRPCKIRDDDNIATSNRKDKAKVNRLRGRHAKIANKNGSLEIVKNQKDKEKEPDEKSSDNKHDENVILKSKKSLKSKEGNADRREQQQVVRDQIVEMLMKAGWTIEYRQRLTKDYKDAVYVDCDGKTHWSVTLAYQKLKAKVDHGRADDKTLSAFTAIPEEVLGTLYRTRNEKPRKDKGSKSGKNPKCKENLNPNPKVRDKHLKRTATKNANNHGRTPKKGCSKPKRDGQARKSIALLARRSVEMSADQDGEESVIYDGKRNLLSWMIDSGKIKLGSKVQCMNDEGTKVMREGKVTGAGICCGCCGQAFTILDFECHAGSTLCQPLQHVCLESGRSLLQCLTEWWMSKQEEYDHNKFNVEDADDPNDDTCNICGDGGDLICCDGCPSTFHQNCLNIEKLPTGNWRCVYCSCKFCGTVADNVDDHLTASELPLCHLCEERFHFSCNEHRIADNLDSMDLIFCGKGCEERYEGLQMLVGVKHDIPEGFSWTVLQRRFVGKEDETGRNNSSSKIECNSRLAVAFSVMDECFMPIVDQRSNINMIHNVVYNCGSNFKRLNYCGFFTIILEKGDELVAAASIRLHGSVLAEMPFIGTRQKFRRQGMCRRLLCAVETALSSLGVEQLVIPAISELHETWTKVFGFLPLEDSKRREMTRMSLIVFPGTDMLQKPLPKKCQGIEEDHIMSPAIAEESSSPQLNANKNFATAEEAEEPHATSPLGSSGGFLHDALDMKTGFESFVPQEALRVQ
ncbi:unnamed protein product [Cuscuta campestris]|uniref:PHD-type domain-containing protein n=1 Tax=Cuscuta campestris TaxID=132261 RepID=A0A484KRG6_9ASTE|nr:unnamed protein product [Cuscuta campestris]